MRRLLALLLAVGCSKADDTAPAQAMTPARIAKGCLEDAGEVAAAIASNPMAPLPMAARGLACPQLYSKEVCGRAWAGLYAWREGPAREDPLQQIAEVNRVIYACASAYCGHLPAGLRACGKTAPATSYNDLVDVLIELDRAALIADRFDAATADALSRRSLFWKKTSLAAPPRADAGPPDAQLVLAITADGHMTLAGAPVAAGELAAELHEAAAKTHSIVIQADTQVPYKQVVDVMDAAKKAGFDKLAISTEGAAP
jgi:hypothetical protein